MKTDREKIDNAARSFNSLGIGHFDLIEMKCWNKEEVDDLSEYAKRKYPKIRFNFTWLVFR